MDAFVSILSSLVALVVFLVLGFFFGVPIGMSYPFSPENKATFLFFVISALILILFGSIKYKHKYGKIILIIGLVLWAFMGLWGLATQY